MADINNDETHLKAQTLIDYIYISEEKKRCILYKSTKRCYQSKITYPDISTIKDKNIAQLIKKDIKKLIDEFQMIQLQNRLKEDTTPHIFDMELYDHETYNIFSFTPKTVTVEYQYSSYEGGAHGSYTTTFINRDKKSHKELKLKDILQNNQEKPFTQFVETFYRKQHHLSASDSMKKAGWIDDKFILAENFAITPQGLYFLYNNYEAKPYADGQETILIPYNKIKKFLSPKYFNTDILKEIEILAHTYKKEFDNNLKISISPTKKDTIKISVEATNRLYSTTQGWLSLSFKEIKNRDIKINILNQNFATVKFYPAGSSIYNIKKRKSISSEYLLVEAEAKEWRSQERKKLEFELKTPKNLKYLTILLRSVHKLNGKFIRIDKALNEKIIIGQQGEKNFVLKIKLKKSTNS